MSDNNLDEDHFEEAPENLDVTTKKTNFIGFVFLGLGALFIGYIAYNAQFANTQQSVEEDEFKANAFKLAEQPPSEPIREIVKIEPKIVIKVEPIPVPKPVAEPHAVPFIIPKPIPEIVEKPETVAVIQKETCDAACQKRLDDLNARLQSPSIIMDVSGSNQNVSNDTNGTDGGITNTANGGQNSFLQSASITKKMIKATKNDRIDALIPQGTIISGILETAINSDLPGQLRAIVNEDVSSFDGRRILIPRGTSLIGEYKSGLDRGQSRVLIIWTRLMRSDGVSIDLNSYGTDNLGVSGLTGHVDEHYIQRFGSAILLSMISAGTKYLDGSSFGGTPAIDELNATTQSLAAIALKDSIDIPPTITVDQGAMISIFVRQDLDFSDLYNDPITEEVNKILNARRNK